MRGTSSQHHFATANLGWWKPGGESLMKILPELLTENRRMARVRLLKAVCRLEEPH